MDRIDTSNIYPLIYPKISITYGNRVELININDIIRCEAQNNYTVFYLTDVRKLISSKPLSDYEKKLSPFQFIRVHQSHLVNFRYMKSYIKGDQCQIIMEDQSVVEVSRRKKADLLRILSSI